MTWGIQATSPHEMDADKVVYVEKDCITTMVKGCHSVVRHGKLPSFWDEIDSPRMQELLRLQKLEEKEWEKGVRA